MYDAAKILQQQKQALEQIGTGYIRERAEELTEDMFAVLAAGARDYNVLQFAITEESRGIVGLIIAESPEELAPLIGETQARQHAKIAEQLRQGALDEAERGK